MKYIQLLQQARSKILTQIVNHEREFRQSLKDRYLKDRREQMSIICNNCGHDNQDDATFCDECGEELTVNAISEEEAMTPEEIEEEQIEAASDEAEDEEEIEEEEIEAASDEAEEEIEEEEIEAASDEAEDEEEIEAASSVPTAAATTLELDEPPMQEIVSPATTLEIPETPNAILIDVETEEEFVLPKDEKISYIGRLNDEFPIQVDLSNINRADLISRVHAAIHYENEVYYLEDAGSANGTWLNDKQIKPGTRFRQELNSGDTIAFGRNQTIELIFNLEDP